MMELIELRNLHFKKACMRVIDNLPPGYTPNTAEVARLASQQPAPHYYCTYEYALRCVRVLRHGRVALREGRRRDMWLEINAKVAERQQLTGESLPTALAHVLAACSASQFFISPRTAHSLACELLAKSGKL